MVFFWAIIQYLQIRGVKAELEKTRKKLEESEGKVASIASQLEIRVEEAERAKRSIAARETGLRQRADLAESRLKEVESFLEKADARLKVCVGMRPIFFDNICAYSTHVYCVCLYIGPGS